MRAKNNKTKQLPGKKHQDSVFKEAWENMNSDMAKVMPGFLSKRLQNRKNKIWVMVAITFVELVVFAVIGKFAYDWFMK